MTTICNGLHGQCVNCIWPMCEPDWRDKAYAAGLLPPNYRLPTPIGEVHIDRDVVDVICADDDAEQCIVHSWYRKPLTLTLERVRT